MPAQGGFVNLPVAQAQAAPTLQCPVVSLAQPLLLQLVQQQLVGAGQCLPLGVPAAPKPVEKKRIRKKRPSKSKFVRNSLDQSVNMRTQEEVKFAAR
eukprot:1406440-Prymnesium_polylepis.1